MRLDDGVRSGWFAAEQSLCQRCMLASLLFNIFFATVMNVAYTRLKADKYIVDASVHLGKQTGRGRAGGSNRQRASPRDVALGHALR